jgi:hypothetical protein
MHITEGEGTGSVVETHATPLGLGPDDRLRTMVTEDRLSGCAVAVAFAAAGHPA